MNNQCVEKYTAPAGHLDPLKYVGKILARQCEDQMKQTDDDLSVEEIADGFYDRLLMEVAKA